MKICSVVIVAWVCWVLVVGTGRVCSSPAAGLMLSESDDVVDKGKLDAAAQPARLGRFKVKRDTTDDEFKAFIEGLTNTLADPTSSKSKIKRLPERWLTFAKDGNSIYGLLELENTDFGVVTLVLSMNDLYLLGFHSSPGAANNAYYYFNDRDESPGAASLFPRASAVSLGYDGSYTKGLAGRDKVSLGNEPLYSAIKTLYQRQGIPSNWKKSLIVVIQMMPEAVRFGLVLDNLVAKWYQYVPPTALMMEVQNKWVKLSDSARKALKNNNVFDPPVSLDDGMIVIRTIGEFEDRRVLTLMAKPKSSTLPPRPRTFSSVAQSYI